MKVYLSGPMRDLPALNFPAFHSFAKLLRAEGHEVFSPAEAKVPQDDIRACMAMDMDWICREAEAIALMPGWVESRGARAELATARAIGIREINLSDSQLEPASESYYQLVLPSSTTSPSPSRRSPRYLSWVKSSTIRPDGIGINLAMNLMLLYVTFLTAGLVIMTACYTLLKWHGGH